jgi:excisionase family DNA binding protein
MKSPDALADDVNFMTTRAVARQLGLAVRSVQLMVDRGELEAWRTSGGHRRIVRQSVQGWSERVANGNGKTFPKSAASSSAVLEHQVTVANSGSNRSVLLIEDSLHFQNLVKLILAQTFPDVTLHVAGDGIVGLAMAGQLQPDVLIIDILLPSIDGATLITTLRSHPQFDRSRVIVLTSLNASQLAPYAFALSGVPVVHKPQLVADLPPLLATLLSVPVRRSTTLTADPR